MADLPPYPDANSATDNRADLGPDHQAPTGTPRWVKVFGILALILALLFVILMLAGGNHGPGRHLPPASAPSSQAPAPRDYALSSGPPDPIRPIAQGMQQP